MLRVQQIIDKPPRFTYLSTTAHQAARAQALGYMRVLSAGTDLRRASDLQTSSVPTSPGVPLPGSSQSNQETQFTPAPDSHIRNHNKVDEEYWLYVQDGTINPEQMEAFEIVQWWIENRYKYPILYYMAMNILPAQASSVSSERVFSSSKLTSTPERNRLSVENMEFLQVLKHALCRHWRDAMTGIVIPTDDDSDELDFVSHLFDNTTEDNDGEDDDLM
ncbi:hAT family dimerization protein, partial [Rhizoctonia solani AG-3 Rhs1AP]